MWRYLLPIVTLSSSQRADLTDPLLHEHSPFCQEKSGKEQIFNPVSLNQIRDDFECLNSSYALEGLLHETQMPAPHRRLLDSSMSGLPDGLISFEFAHM
jgi:hypothetical protein